MIKHIVMMRLRTDIDFQFHAGNLIQRLEDLQKKIDVVDCLEAGRNISDSPRSSDIVLYTEFKDLDNLDIYRTHPAHQSVVDYLQEIVSEIRVTDYEV